MNNRGLRLRGCVWFAHPPHSLRDESTGGATSPTRGTEGAVTAGQLPRRTPHERGMVTLELALGLLAATAVALVLSWVVSLVSIQTACADTASQVARQLARGDEQAAADAEGKAPAGAVVQTSEDGGRIRVDVTLDASLGLIGPVPLSGSAVIAKEPGA